MRASRRRSWVEIDHDGALLLDQIARRNGLEERGSIAELLPEKQAEPERQTSSRYRAALLHVRDLPSENATVGRSFTSKVGCLGIGLSVSLWLGTLV